MYIFCTKHVHLLFKTCTCFAKLIRLNLFLNRAKTKKTSGVVKKGVLAGSTKRIYFIFMCLIICNKIIEMENDANVRYNQLRFKKKTPTNAMDLSI